MTAAARVVLTLNLMSTTEAAKLGVDDEDRWRLVQVTMDKSNRAPLEKADWYRKASVNLGPGDSAGAIERWDPPRAADIVTPEVIAAVAVVFGGQDRRASAQSPDWAGYAIAEALELECPNIDSKSKSVPFLRAARVSPPAHI
jgi:hypothetical protein